MTDIGDALILVIDDDPFGLECVRIYLEDEGFNVRTAISVKEGLTAAEETQPQIVITDIDLPDGSGDELVEKLKEKFEFSAIGLSGYDLNSLTKERAALFSAHVSKPVDFEELVKKIKSLIA